MNEPKQPTRDINIRVCRGCFNQEDPWPQVRQALRQPVHPGLAVDLFYEQAPVLRHHTRICPGTVDRLKKGIWSALTLTLPEDLYYSFLETRGIRKGRRDTRPEFRSRED